MTGLDNTPLSASFGYRVSQKKGIIENLGYFTRNSLFFSMLMMDNAPGHLEVVVEEQKKARK